ncbi:uncharacterized protein LOC124634147 [Helicoverpa zea]|uniref:uncharacterized protein LOC124634147 n=1 Tax=Helicoverpa zea TaxID=7113 RepID=UPI001F5637D4|nr:uncharacterized protein LOC124634147 [Helicoverpa zea]
MYALRTAHYGPTEGLVDDDALPRNTLHSVYKFGWCTPDVIQKVFLRKRANITLSDFQSTQATYIYLLEDGETIRYWLACIVMKIYVPRKFMFRKSRLPLYYCQGDLHFVWKLTFQKIDLHEFYLHYLLNIPANFFFEFYHATPL